MARVGVVLAAGESSRLPGKLMLPQKGDGGPVVMSAVEFCKRHCERVYAIVNPLDVVVPWLRTQFTEAALEFSYQLEPLGVCHALRLVDPADEVLITFGDNIYPERWTPVVGRASVGESVRPWASQLDGHNGSIWKSRNELPVHKFAGWMLLTREMLLKLRSCDKLVEGMNAADVEPHLISLGGWWDLGTLQAYTEYLGS